MVEPVKISWSSLQRFEDCAHRDWLVKGGHTNLARDIRIFLPGNVVDRSMKAWLDDPVAGALPDMAEEYLVKFLAESQDDGVVHWKGVSDRQRVVAFCQELLTKLEPVLWERVVPFEYMAAFRFTAPVLLPWLDGSPTLVHLTGEMDLLVKSPLGYYVWDLKSSIDNNYWKKSLGQLVFYDLATHALFDEIPYGVGFLQPMATPEVLEFQLKDKDRAAMWSRIARMAVGKWRHDSQPKLTTTNCGRCEVKASCCRYLPVDPASRRAPLLSGVW